MSSLQALWLDQRCCLCLQLCGRQICQECAQNLATRPISFKREGLPLAWATADYTELTAKLIHAFKSTGSVQLASTMAKLWVASWGGSLALALAKNFAGCELVLVPAPSRVSATLTRGYVPAELFAKALASQLKGCYAIHVSVDERVWLCRSVADQSQLGVAERQQNLQHAMLAAKGSGKKQALAIVDDVVTTGATAREVARALAQNGTEAKFLFAFAETRQKHARQI